MSSLLICVLLKLNLGWHGLYCTVAPSKGQLISKGLFVCHCLDQKSNEMFLKISALAFKKSSTQKTLLYNYVK